MHHSRPKPEKDDESIEGEAGHGHEDVERHHSHPLRWAGLGELEPETRDNLKRKYFMQTILGPRVETLNMKNIETL